MKQSKLLSLNMRDYLRGLAMAALSSGLTGLYKIIDGGAMPTMKDFRTMGMVALAAGLSYLLKNLFTAPDKKTN